MKNQYLWLIAMSSIFTTVCEAAPQGLLTAGTYLTTLYHFTEESKSTPRSEKTRNIYAYVNGESKVIAKVSPNWFNVLLMEGQGRLVDHRIINYSGSMNGTYYFSEADPLVAPWGYGIHNRPLTPFRSVAVDGSIIPVGSKIYIRITDGMPLPDGSIHDGWWVADDQGRDIRNHHIDLFVGNKNGSKVLNDYIHSQKIKTKIKVYPAD